MIIEPVVIGQLVVALAKCTMANLGEKSKMTVNTDKKAGLYLK